jgi:hypothetical protein
MRRKKTSEYTLASPRLAISEDERGVEASHLARR